jgi:hypothetical protein
MPEIEKYAPSRAVALKKKFAEINKNSGPERTDLTERVASVDSSSVDGLIEAAAKAPPEIRDTIWTQAAMKALTEGDPDRAMQMAEHCSDPDDRDSILEQINAQALSRATDAGHLDEARQLLSHASVEERVNVLTQFASRASMKGDKKAALQILEEARDQIGARAADGAELAALLEIARTYAAVDPARSFEIVEAIVDHHNTLLAAAAVVDGFEVTKNFKDGELVPLQGGSQLISLALQFAADSGMLARADFDRARALADKFQPSELRLKAQLSVAQGILSDNLLRVTSPPISGRYLGRPIVVNLNNMLRQMNLVRSQ